MKIMVVDDEILALKSMELKIGKCTKDAELVSFQYPEKALNWIKEGNEIELAFLDMTMTQMDGIELAEKIRELLPHCVIVFVTGYENYAIKAFSIKANGYLVKPVELSELQAELDHAAELIALRKAVRPVRPEKDVYLHCFGAFDVFVNRHPVHFHRKKSKEMLAYLTDRRGANVTMPEMAEILWEDGIYDISRNRQLHTFLSDLQRDLKKAGAPELIRKNRNNLSLDAAIVDCDYYDYLQGDEMAKRSFMGEYMTQYSWAEMTLAKLTEDTQKQ
ncbi:MAG: response regulator [Eubacteriales bacterium]|nr:response regulator [Eubacteriales bacterium]